MRFLALLLGLLFLFAAICGCMRPTITLFPSQTSPLKEITLQGEGKEKVLVIPVQGFLSERPKRAAFFPRPGLVEKVVAQLRRAAKDPNIKALVLKIDSPGGTITATDILYHEIELFRKRTGSPIVAAMMDLATSGGYYISLPADWIIAHPTTVTGSIGVIFLQPRITGLMSKIGFGIEVHKSGKNKDMGSPFRASTGEEQQIFQRIIDSLGTRFLSRVNQHRHLKPQVLVQIKSAQVYLAQDALRLGLIDHVGYLNDAIEKAKQLADLPENARVVAYRRHKRADDNIYNTVDVDWQQTENHLLGAVTADIESMYHPGFYYLWLPGAGVN